MQRRNQMSHREPRKRKMLERRKRQRRIKKMVKVVERQRRSLKSRTQVLELHLNKSKR